MEPETIFNDKGDSSQLAFDGKHSTIYDSSSSSCFIGIDVGENKRVAIHRIRYFPYNRWTIAANYIKGAVIEGSVDGTNYIHIHTVDQAVHAGWKSFLSTSSTIFRYVRLRHSSASRCRIAEF